MIRLNKFTGRWELNMRIPSANRLVEATYRDKWDQKTWSETLQEGTPILLTFKTREQASQAYDKLKG